MSRKPISGRRLKDYLVPQHCIGIKYLVESYSNAYLNGGEWILGIPTKTITEFGLVAASKVVTSVLQSDGFHTKFAAIRWLVRARHYRRITPLRSDVQ